MRTVFRLLLIAMLFSLVSACAPIRYSPGSTESSGGGYVKRGKPYKIDGKWYYPLASGESYDATGIASWYGEKFHGNQTANGETYNMYAMTAAHTTLPMPSLVLVTNLENGRQVKVRVNDRGPFVKSRLIDLSYAAAKELGYAEQGTARVRVQTLQSPDLAQENAAFAPVVSLPESQSSLSKSPLSKSPLSKSQQPQQQAALKLAYIQLGAFSVRESADKVVAQLQHLVSPKHPPLNVFEANNMFRVRIGPFDLDADARQMLTQVKENGHSSAMIIHD